MATSKMIVLDINDTPMKASSGDIIDRFIDGLKPAPKKYVEDNAPVGWWTILGTLFDKALHFEVNSNASLGNTGRINAMAMG